MARLGDLKSLLAQRKAAAAAQPPRGSSPARQAAASVPAAASAGAAPPAQPAHAALPAPPARRVIAAAKHADGDIDFRTVVADVTPLKTPARAPRTRPPPPPVPRQRIADEADALHASKFGAEPAPQTWDIGQEPEGEQTFLRAGLGTDVLARLRRGHWSVQAELDLHGLTSTEAHDTLADFLAEARQHGWRCVRVVHGKGLSSPGREPVLKGKVRRWLAQRDDVLAYAEAPRHAGGGGAVLVLLRAR